MNANDVSGIKVVEIGGTADVEQTSANKPNSGPQPPQLARISAARGGSVWGLDPDGALWGSTEDEVPWQPRPADAGVGPFASLSAASDGTVYAVDRSGVPYTYQGSWLRLGSLADGTLASASVGSADAVWGVDAAGRLLRYTPQTKTWQQIPGPVVGGAVARCAATLDGSLFCVTADGTAYQYTGSGRDTGSDAATSRPEVNPGNAADWIALPAPAPLTDIAAGAGGWIWVVSVAGGLLQYSGQGWEAVGGPGGGPVAGVAAGADLTVWVLDRAGQLFQFDAAHTAWLPIPAPAALAGLALGALDAAWALTADQKVYQYTESTAIWSPAGAPGVYAELAAVDGGTLWLVDRERQVVRLTASDGTWTVTGQPVGPLRLAAGQDGSLWGVDASGAVLGFDPAASTWHPLPAAPAPAVKVSAGDAASVTALDAAGVVYAYDPATARWAALSEGAPEGGFTDIGTVEGGTVFAVATADSGLYEYLGIWVSSVETATAVAVVGAYDVWILDTEGRPQHALRSGGEGTQSSAPDLPGWDAEDVFGEARSTHLWIVNRAIRLAGSVGGPAAQWLVSVLHPGEGRIGDPLHDNMCQGLYDADFVAPYNDPVFGKPTYASHFYDPTTGKNWLGFTSPTALTQGAQYFHESVAAYLDGLLDTPQGAGYRLGLALHYMTDVTQPMHAANFTVLNSKRIGYHTDYEGYILGYQSDARFRPNAYPIPELGGDPAAYLIAAARHSLPYVNVIAPEKLVLNYSGLNEALTQLARQTAPDLLGYAIAATAGFLLAWADQAYRRPADWEDHGQPAQQVTAVEGIAATTVTGRPYLWVKGSDGNLWVRWYTGRRDLPWRWDEQGRPPAGIGAGIGADTSSVGPAAFMFDQAGNVVAQWWNNPTQTWNWTVLGGPVLTDDESGDEPESAATNAADVTNATDTEATAATQPTATRPTQIVAAAVAALPQDTAVFTLTAEGRLFKNQVPDFTWQEIQPPPTGSTPIRLYGATNADGNRCVLSATADGQLWLWRESSGVSGTWLPIVSPNDGATLDAGFGVAPYVAYFLTSAGDVRLCQWDVGQGSGNWFSIYQPPGDLNAISGLTINTAQTPLFNALVMSRTDAGPLAIGAQSGWDVRGEPGETTITSPVGFLQFQNDFLTAVVGADGHLWA